jgi:PAS domain S-box-containing protein
MAQPDATAQKKTILLIEDNPGDARIMREYLREPAAAGFAMEHAETLAAGLERLGREGIDLVLLDLTLPDSAGFDTFTRVQAREAQVPIIVLSGQDDEALAIRTVHEGAQDYLVKGKGLDSRLLARAMRYAIERKQAEEALAKERDLLHMLLGNLPDRIYFKDENSRFLRISKAVAEQFKISHPREAIGKTDFEFFAREHAQAAREDEQRIMATGEPIIAKVEREILPDGRVTWALTSKLPLREKQEGRIVGTFGISRDITELKNFEEALAAERNLLRNLIDNLPDYIYVKDTECRFVLDNIAHRRFLGVARQEEVAGKTSADFFPAEMAAAVAGNDSELLRTGKPLVNEEEKLADRNGGERWYVTTKVPLRGVDGQMVGLVGISRDITERKLGEQQLHQANQELARKQAALQEAHDALQQSHEELKSAQFQLIQAEKMQSVGRLAAGVAHEVKNPLAILGMGLDYLTKNLVSGDTNVAVILTDMNEALHRADSIIKGMLDFSMPSALDLRGEQLNDIISQSLWLVRHHLAANHIQVVRELAPDLPLARLDKQKIQQVCLNVLTNAIYAMPSEGTLTVRTGTRELKPTEIEEDSERRFDRFREGETVVCAEILDTGTGIPEEKLSKIFDPFFTTKPAGKGTGLGLTVTKKIIELHGGHIVVQNRAPRGVAVTLWFKKEEVSHGKTPHHDHRR